MTQQPPNARDFAAGLYIADTLVAPMMAQFDNWWAKTKFYRKLRKDIAKGMDEGWLFINSEGDLMQVIKSSNIWSDWKQFRRVPGLRPEDLAFAQGLADAKKRTSL